MAFLYSNFANSTLASAVEDDTTLLVIQEEDAHLFPEPGAEEEFAVILWDGVREPEICYASVRADNSLTVTRGEEDTVARAWLAGTQVRHALTSGTLFSLIQQETIAALLASQPQAEEGSNNTLLMTPLRTTQHFAARTTDLTQGFLLAETQEQARRVLGWATATFSGTGLQSSFDIGDTGYDSEFTRVYVDEVFVPSTEYSITNGVVTFDNPPPEGTDNVVVVLGTDFAFSVSLPGAGSVDTSALQDEAVTKPKIKPGEIYGNLIPNQGIESVHYKNDSIPTSAYAPGSVDSAALAAGAVATANMQAAGVTRAILATVERIPIGMVSDFAGSAAPTGWLLCYGQAISRATYSALFAVLSTTWGVGNGTTTFNLPDLRGRVVAGVDNMGGDAAARLTGTSGGVAGSLGSAGGDQRHILQINEMPSHRHSHTRPRGNQIFPDGSGNVYWGSNFNVTTNSSYEGGDDAHNNVQPTAVMNKIIFTGVP